MKFEVGKTYSSTYGELKTLTVVRREGRYVTVRDRDINSSQLIEEDSDGEYFNFIWCGGRGLDIIRADQERIRAQQSAVIYAFNESGLIKVHNEDYSVTIPRQDNVFGKLKIESRGGWEIAYSSAAYYAPLSIFWGRGLILWEPHRERLKRFFDLLLNHFNRGAYFTQSRVLSVSPDVGRLEVYRQALKP